jgi:ABC-2 type transport system ATP-binding protein
MHKGRIIMDDNPDTIKRSLGLPMVEMWSDDARSALNIIKDVDGVRGVSLYGNKLHVALVRTDLIDDIILLLKLSNISIQGHRLILPSIEDIFISRVESL